MPVGPDRVQCLPQSQSPEQYDRRDAERAGGGAQRAVVRPDGQRPLDGSRLGYGQLWRREPRARPVVRAHPDEAAQQCQIAAARSGRGALEGDLSERRAREQLCRLVRATVDRQGPRNRCTLAPLSPSERMKSGPASQEERSVTSTGGGQARGSNRPQSPYWMYVA